MMRTCFDILGFELRQQIRSPFLLAALLIFFLIHVLAASSTGIRRVKPMTWCRKFF